MGCPTFTTCPAKKRTYARPHGEKWGRETQHYRFIATMSRGWTSGSVMAKGHILNHQTRLDAEDEDVNRKLLLVSSVTNCPDATGWLFVARSGAR
jgi:hypothetical protein